MGLISLVLVLALVGFIVYLLITYIPMPQMFKTAIVVIVVIVLVLYVIRLLGVPDIPIGR
jgi:hypothetical protein